MDSIDPWDTPTDAAELLYEVDAVLRRYVSMQDWARQLVCLYVVFSHCLDAFDIAPRLFITSPVRGCGKTLLIRILSKLCARPEINSGTSRAGLYSAIDSGEAITLLLDEAQHWARKSGPLMTVLDGGFTRDTAFIRLFPGGVAKKYNTFAAFIVAAIGNPFPDTFDDRCIMVSQQRSRPDEQLEDFRSDRTSHLTELRRKLGRWALDNEAALRAADPEMPEVIRGRTADKLRPLVAIADRAGGGWPEIARAAILQSIIETDEPDDAAAIIADCARIIERHETGRIRSADLVVELRGEDRKYRDLTPKALSLLLAPFQIRPQMLRFGSQTTLHGYQRSDFDDAIIRYGVDLSAPDDPRAPTPSATVTTATSVKPVIVGIDGGDPEPAAPVKRRYWLTPPDLKKQWDDEFHFDFDACPHPRPDGFDGLTMRWPGNSRFCNPPFTGVVDEQTGKKNGPLTWARKAVAEFRRTNKLVVVALPLYQTRAIALLLEAGAEMRPIGAPAWLSIEDGLPNPKADADRNPCALFILWPVADPREDEPSADEAVEKIANPPEVIELGPSLGDTSASPSVLTASPSSEPDEDVPSAKPPPKGRGRPPARKPKRGDRLVIWGTNRHGGRWEVLWVPAGMEPGQDIQTVGGTYYSQYAARKAAKRAAKRYGMPLQDEAVEHDET